MERMMKDMRRMGMLVECEDRKGYFEAEWPRGVEMNVVEVVEIEEGEVEGKAELESEKEKGQWIDSMSWNDNGAYRENS